MEYHIGQAGRLFKAFKLVADDAVLAGPPRFLSQYQIVVCIVRPHELFQPVLLFLPVAQDKGKGFGKPYLTDAAFCLWFFQDKPGGWFAAHQPGEYKKDILFPKCVNRPLVNTGKFLFNPYICVIVCNVFICDVEAVPGQAGDLPHPHGAGKSQIDCNVEFPILAVVESLADGIRRPDCPDFLFPFRQVGILKRVFANDIPPDCLMESAPEEFNNLFDGAGRHILRFRMAVWSIYRGCFLKLLDIFIHSPFVDVLDNKVSNQRIDIVVDQRRIAGIDRKAPFLFSIKINKLL